MRFYQLRRTSNRVMLTPLGYDDYINYTHAHAHTVISLLQFSCNVYLTVYSAFIPLLNSNRTSALNQTQRTKTGWTAQSCSSAFDSSFNSSFAISLSSQTLIDSFDKRHLWQHLSNISIFIYYFFLTDKVLNWLSKNLMKHPSHLADADRQRTHEEWVFFH